MDILLSKTELNKFNKHELLGQCTILQLDVNDKFTKKHLIELLLEQQQKQCAIEADNILQTFDTELKNKLVINGIIIPKPTKFTFNERWLSLYKDLTKHLSGLQKQHKLQQLGILMSNEMQEELNITKKYYMLYTYALNKQHEKKQKKQLEKVANEMSIAREHRSLIMHQAKPLIDTLLNHEQHKTDLYKILNKFIEEKKREIGITALDIEINQVKDLLNECLDTPSKCQISHTFHDKPNFKYGKYKWTSQYCNTCNCSYIIPQSASINKKI